MIDILKLKNYINCKIKFFLPIFMVVLGSFLFSIGVKWFVEKNNLITGGVAGLSLILNKFFEYELNLSLPLGLINFILSLPIFLFSYVVCGLKFLHNSIFTLIAISCWLSLLNFAPNICNLNSDLFCVSICGAFFCGIGTGLMLKFGSSSGGTDMFANTLNKLCPNISIPAILFITDFVILSSGLIYFNLRYVVYSVFMSFIASQIINKIISL